MALSTRLCGVPIFLVHLKLSARVLCLPGLFFRVKCLLISLYCVSLQPAGGSHFHYLHHAHYDCNYGTPMIPFDWLFGTVSQDADEGAWVAVDVDVDASESRIRSREAENRLSAILTCLNDLVLSTRKRE